MSGASEALASLQATVAPHLAAIANAVRGASTAQGRFRAADDLLPGVADTADLILALEALTKASKEAHDAARATLAATMADTGATSIDTGTHVVSVSDGRTSVEVVDADAVPPELMSTPKPAPDKKKIAVFLKANTVNWARTVTGAPILTIRKSED